VEELIARAGRISARLIARKETVAMVESAAGGLVCAALLAVPGASAYCRGGIVVYTGQAWKALRDFDEALLEGHRSATEGNARVRARLAKERFNATWGLGETGAAGPTGNRYGDPAGHAWVAVCGPTERTLRLHTGNNERLANMLAFAAAALDLFEQCLS
jgi:PncC family amidohydrolase